MAYTVKKLSELSHVSIRTLHYYEEIGLLKPAYYGENGYRYYEEKELLLLQQILFFKELGFTLKQIQKVLGRNDFDQLTALYSHKKTLLQEREKMRQLLKTIDKTIQHLKGKKKMKDKEIFDGFHMSLVTRAKESASYFVAEALVLASVKNFVEEKREPSFHEDVAKRAHAIFKDLVVCIEKGLAPTSQEVQRLIRKHHAFAQEFHNASKEVYKALAQLYLEHPVYRKQLDPFHPQLASFMASAMKVFADQIKA